jgi:hypothetical protein
MPLAEGAARQLPLALRILVDELEQLEAGFEDAARAQDRGERDARRSDVLRAVDRYLRLEEEVFFPVLDRRGCEHAEASASHACVRAALGACGEGTDDACIEGTRASVQAHRYEQAQRTLPRLAHALGDELPALALELEEVRQRMKGAWGV